MSQGTVMIQTQSRLHEKDFTIATPEEFVHRFGGTRVINKVISISNNIFFLFIYLLNFKIIVCSFFFTYYLYIILLLANDFYIIIKYTHCIYELHYIQKFKNICVRKQYKRRSCVDVCIVPHCYNNR